MQMQRTKFQPLYLTASAVLMKLVCVKTDFEQKTSFSKTLSAKGVVSAKLVSAK
jgi:hypothetical protein